MSDLECKMVWIIGDTEGMIITCAVHDSDWISSDRREGCHYFLLFFSLQHMNYSDNTQLSSKSG